MVEPEMAFAELDDIMSLAEDYVSYIVQTVIERCQNELTLLQRDLEALKKVRPPFPRISYDEAFDILENYGTETARGSDFGGSDETIISNHFDRPVIIHRYPTRVKAFYMEPDPEKPNRALCMDMLASEGYGEIIGGSQRIHELDLLKKRIQEHDLPEEAFSWYTDLRRYGSVPHSGFGMGIERVVSWVSGLSHVRETIPFPRLLNKIYP